MIFPAGQIYSALAVMVVNISNAWLYMLDIPFVGNQVIEIGKLSLYFWINTKYGILHSVMPLGEM